MREKKWKKKKHKKRLKQAKEARWMDGLRVMGPDASPMHASDARKKEEKYSGNTKKEKKKKLSTPATSHRIPSHHHQATTRFKASRCVSWHECISFTLHYAFQVSSALKWNWKNKSKKRGRNHFSRHAGWQPRESIQEQVTTLFFSFPRRHHASCKLRPPTSFFMNENAQLLLPLVKVINFFVFNFSIHQKPGTCYDRFDSRDFIFFF